MKPNQPNFEQIKQALQAQLPALAKQYHVESLGIFGSYVRNEQEADSDLDLLVTFSQTPGLLRFIELENHLSDLLNVKVDLVMKDALKSNIGKYILREVIPVV
jgi:predicted nucleotidyltransferase